MLVEFRVKNFRSLRDEQIFSLVASKDKSLQDTHLLATGLTAVPALLPSAVIYGANASGKSNLIKAMQYMRGVVLESATIIKPGQTYTIQPFRLDVESSHQPTEFEMTFLLGGVRYQYSFAMTPQRIIHESLFVYKASKPQHWFERNYDEKTDKDCYKFSSEFKGSKHTWVTNTRDNALFLSTAVQLNSADLRPVFDWFVNDLLIFNELSPLTPQLSIQMLQQAQEKKEICRLMNMAGINIADIAVETRKVPSKSLQFDFINDNAEIRNSEMDQYKLYFHYITERGEARFEFGDESSGTRNLTVLVGPILMNLKKGATLIIDELDSSLHTLLVRALVDLFHQPTSNTSGAQLIFTTHDTSLMDAYGLFRRDQIWFLEKDRQQASTLIPLSDFSPRKNEALERGYLQGRYGAIPLLGNLREFSKNGSR